MKHDGRWSGMLDHLTAAALYDEIKEHLFSKLGWPLWVTILFSGVLAVGIFLIRRGWNADKDDPTTPQYPPPRDELGPKLKVYFGAGQVDDVPLAFCRTRASRRATKLQIKNAATCFTVLPLDVEVAGRRAIALFSYAGAAAYAVSSECEQPEAINAIVNGVYDVKLELPSGLEENWTLEVGYGCTPALKPTGLADGARHS